VHSDRPSAAERSPSVRQAHCVRVDTHLEHGKRQRRHLVEVHVLKVFERPDHVSMPSRRGSSRRTWLPRPAQLGGMIDAGFVIAGFYEDRRTEEDGNPIRFYLPSQFIVRALAVDP
jgi:hypothetical protein